MTAGWAALNTLRDEHLGEKSAAGVPRPDNCEICAALALVQTALEAAENHLDSTDLVLGGCDIAHLELTVGPLREALDRLGKDTAA